MSFLPNFFARKEPERTPSHATAPGPLLPKVSIKPQIPMAMPRKRSLPGADHFSACVDRYSDIPARRASVAAYVAWRQELGRTGRTLQSELCQEYLMMCDHVGCIPMPAKWFGKTLEAFGCGRQREECGTPHKRSRPNVIYIPRIATDRARNGHQSPHVHGMNTSEKRVHETGNRERYAA